MEERKAQGDFATLLSGLSDDVRVRGRQFEQIVKWWLLRDPVQGRQIKTAWLWDEWPDYPGRDIGIDLVAQMTDGTLTAVQAKCIDPSRSIPKSELDSFISAASNHTFSHRLLVATTNGLSANAQRMLADQQVVRVMLSDLESSLEVWPTSIDELDDTPTQPLATQRPHQQRAVGDVVNGLAKHDRGQLIMACGTGKTLTALWIAEEIEPETTLVLVPSLNLLSQTLSEWAKNTRNQWSYLCVCSDETVNKADDRPISTIDELPFEVTTDCDKIASFLRHQGPKILFSTYQSSARVAEAQANTGSSFGLVICDEAHRLTGKIDANYSTVLDNKKIVADKRLFMTATPRTYTPIVRSRAEQRGVEITSMDDVSVYGPVLHKLSFGEAIQQNLLSDYRVVIVGVTDIQVQELIERRELVSVNDTITTDARTLAAHIGLAKATKDYGLRRTISFHSRIKAAEQFAGDHPQILNWLPEAHKPDGTNWAGTISGAMNTGERRRILNQLRIEYGNRHALLTNARCLTEGVDVPTLDGVAFIDPRSSQIDIIQAVGRAIRKSPDKEFGTIVLAVNVSTSTDVESQLNDSLFRPVCSVLNALKSHDDQLEIEFSNLRTRLGRTGSVGGLPSRIIEDFPVDIESLAPGFVEAFEISLLEGSTSPWDSWVGLVEKFADSNHHCRIPHNFEDGGYRLGQWVNSQRTRYKDGRLGQERIHRLEQVPYWSWNELADVWQENVSLLEEFVLESDLPSWPPLPRHYKGRNLAGWAQMQRSRFRKGELEADRISRLESIKGWSWSPRDELWEESIACLSEFVNSHGHSRVPRGFVVDEVNLGRWVSKQRGRYRDGRLPEDRILQLEAFPGWTWDPHGYLWSMGYDSLSRFARVNGNADPEQSCVFEGYRLGQWVTAQRGAFKKGKLSEQEISALECLPGWTWNVLESSWSMFFDALVMYANETGVARPPKTLVYRGLQLGAWASAQRTNFAKGKVNGDRIEKLESLPGWVWNTAGDVWEKNFDALRHFAEQTDAANPSQGTIFNSRQLGVWVNGQRQKYRRGLLNLEVQRRFEELPGWSWTPSDGMWEAAYGVLKRYVDEFGTPNVAPERGIYEGVDLPKWISRQRQYKRRGLLNHEQVDKLESIAGWTWKPHSDAWDGHFAILEEFVRENGNALVPQSKKSRSMFRGVDLSSWVNSQRTRYSKGLLEPERIIRLEALEGWSWAPKSDAWEEMLSLLERFVEEFGHALVPQGTAARLYRGKDLSRWVNKQRSRYNSGNLESERQRRLEDVPGWVWSPFEHEWQAMFDLLARYVEEMGDCNVSRCPKLYEGRNLSSWVTKQKRDYRKDRLKAPRIAKLEQIPGWSWDPHVQKAKNPPREQGVRGRGERI